MADPPADPDDPRGLTARVFAFSTELERAEAPLLDKHATLLDRVDATLRRHDLLCRGEALVVGVSGGPDSLALLDLLHRLSEPLGFRLHVAHLDHQLRSDSADDARFVASLAGRLGVPATLESADVERLARERHLGIEGAARQARYDLFGRVAARTNAMAVALGHTADDQVETILLALIRGAGPGGLRGMRVTSERRVDGLATPLRILRPLLDVTRSEIEGYLLDRGIEPRRDPTNDETEYRRNRVRHEILPVLRELNPAVDSTIRRLGRLADQDERCFEARVAELWPSVAEVADAAVSLRRADLAALPPSYASRLLRRAFTELVGDSRELEAGHVEAARSLIASGRTGSALDWPRGVRVRLGYEWLSVEASGGAGDRTAMLAESVPLEVPGATPLPTGARILARLTPEPCRWEYTGASHADLDLDLAGLPLSVRRRQPGDRMLPMGMSGEKKLQDLLVDAKVPRSERDGVPIVEGPSGIVWVAGVRAGERFRVGPATRRVLCLRLVGRKDPDWPDPESPDPDSPDPDAPMR